MEADSCIYIRPEWDDAAQCNKYSIVTLYVDDLIIACSNIQMCKSLEKEFGKQYHMKVLGEIKHILGMDVEIDPVTYVYTCFRRSISGGRLETTVSMDRMVHSSYTQHKWTAGNHVSKVKVQKQVQKKHSGCSHDLIVSCLVHFYG